MRRTLGAACLLAVSVGSVSAASAQSVAATREQELIRQREEKAQHLVPYKAGRLEKWIRLVEDRHVLEKFLLSRKNGFKIKVGSIHSGGGIGLGLGYKVYDLFDHRADFSVSSAYTLRGYSETRTELDMPALAGNRLFARLSARARDFPQEDFFGLGPGSRRGDRVNYAYREKSGAGRAGIKLAPWLAVGSELEYVAPDVGSGRDPRFPTIEKLFTDASTPGLAAQPNFIRYEAFTDIDYTEPRGNPRAGGRYAVAYHRVQDRQLDRYSFRRLDVDLRQYLPFLKQRRVIALRSLLSLSDTDAGQQVPFYLQRSLGGSTTLRGFREWRFRDRNILLLQAEYRWEILPALDAAIFYDTGKVVPTRGQINLDDLEHDYGFGFRFGTNHGVFLRIDSAFGSSGGKHFFLRFGNVF